MAELKTKLGRVPCPCCSTPVVLRSNAAGTLSFTCDECDLSAFAKKGAAAQKLLTAKLPAAPKPADKPPARKPDPDDETPPDPAKPASKPRAAVGFFS